MKTQMNPNPNPNPNVCNLILNLHFAIIRISFQEHVR